MRYKLAFWFLFVCLSSSFAIAQISIDQPFQFKDLMFPEVAAGGGLETLVTVSNRGTVTYNGTAYLRTGVDVPWNPIVNGTPITGGEFSVSIPPKSTIKFLITASSIQVGGMVIITDEDTSFLDNYIEGNLTYFITSAGVDLDSIGVLPATPFLAASLPFDDFNGITLAFMNADFLGRTANVTLKLYDSQGTSKGTYGPSQISPGEQRASYLYQLFPSVSSLATGRVEIQSDIPITGIAMTQTMSGQFSSLPLGSTVRTYNVSTQNADVGLTKIALWTNGPFVNGYLIVTYQSLQEFVLAYGQISGEGSNQRLYLFFTTNSEISGNSWLIGIAETAAPFTWSNTTFTGEYTVVIPDMGIQQDGDFTAVLAIP